MSETSSVTLRVPDFEHDGVVYSDIEVTVQSGGDMRDVVHLTKTLERSGNSLLS
jgi:hypothetical protein